MTGRYKKLRPYDEAPRGRRSLIPSAPDSAAGLWFALAAIWLLVAAGIGLLWVGLRIAPAFFPEALPNGIDFSFAIPIVNWTFAFTPETVTSGFFAALVWGWLTNAAIAGIWYVTPRLTGQPLASNALANVGLVLWNLGVAASLAAAYINELATPGLLMEAPWWIDGLPLLALLVVNLVFWRSVLTSIRGAYVSIYYLGLGLLALLGFYGLGALSELPFISLNDTTHALIAAAFLRLVFVYWVVGAAVGALYYVVPRATGNPLYSSGLALLGLALWFVLGIASALGALLDPSVPRFVTALGSAATIMLVVHAFIVIANLFLTISGRWSLLLGTGSVAFAVVSLAFLGASAMLDAIGSLSGVQALVGRTSWTMGSWLFLTGGAATFAWYATADHGLPRILRRDWHATPLARIQLWGTFGGVTVAGLALMAGGLAEGSLRAAAAAPEELRSTLAWFDVAAGIGFGLIALGALAFLGELFLIFTSGHRADYVVAPVTAAPPPASAAAADPATATGS